MKLLMPKKKVDVNDYHAMLNTNSLRGYVQTTAKHLGAEIVECDYDVFYQYAFVGEAYRIALYHALYGENVEEVKTYISRCVDVFEGRLGEMEFMDGGFPDYVQRGFDRILTTVEKKLQANGISGGFGKPPTLH